MNANLLASVSVLSNDELLSRVKRLVSREREATAYLVGYLAEVDARRLYLGEGCASLFAYCLEVLHHLIEHPPAGAPFPILGEVLNPECQFSASHFASDEVPRLGSVSQLEIGRCSLREFGVAIVDSCWGRKLSAGCVCHHSLPDILTEATQHVYSRGSRLTLARAATYGFGGAPSWSFTLGSMDRARRAWRRAWALASGSSCSHSRISGHAFSNGSLRVRQ